MTRRKNRKRLARERAAKTGESYITALRIIRARSQETAVTTPPPTQAQRAQRITALLVSRGLLTQENLESALDEKDRTAKSLGRILLDRKLVDEADLMAAIAAEIGVDFVDLDDYPVDLSAVTLMSDALARRYTALPIGWDEGRLIVAMADPGDVVAIGDIRTITGLDVKTVLATRDAIVAASRRHRATAQSP